MNFTLVDSFVSHLHKYVLSNCDTTLWVDLPEVVCHLCGTKSILPTDFKKCIYTLGMNITDEQIKILFAQFNSDTSVNFFGYKKNETVITIDEVRRLVKNELLEEQFNYLHNLFQQLNQYYENNLSANNCIYSRFHKDQDLFDAKCIRKTITFNCFKCYNIMFLKTNKYDNMSIDYFAQIIDAEWNPVLIKQCDRIITYKHTTKTNTEQIVQLKTDIKNSHEANSLLQKTNIEQIVQLKTDIKNSHEANSLLQKTVKSCEDQLVSLNGNALYFDNKMSREILELNAYNSDLICQIRNIKQIVDSVKM
jgi:hypothetical protein